MFIPQMFRGQKRPVSGGGFWEAMLGGVSSSQSKAGIRRDEFHGSPV